MAKERLVGNLVGFGARRTSSIEGKIQEYDNYCDLSSFGDCDNCFKRLNTIQQIIKIMP
jgi:hypothetical protein